MTALLEFWRTHFGELLQLVRQHIVLVIVSTGVATALGLPAGILAARRPAIGRPLLAIANVAQTIPSLALFGFLLPLPFIGGVGPRTALVTLTLYALLPIVRTTVAGLRSLDRAVLDAGVAMGMTARQLLLMVELPLALPSIVAGIRVAAVVGVGTATIAAAIGAGGLGEYIFRGLSMLDSTMILAGAVPAAALALIVDGALAGLERMMRAERRRPRVLAAAGIAAVALTAALVWPMFASRSGAVITVGSKNFTEQIILGEIVAQAIEAEGGNVSRKLNLGGTFICDRAVRSADIDLYVEYTGTAVTAVFHETVPHDPAQALDLARRRYAAAGLTAGDRLGFDNTFAILVRGSDARAHGLRSIEDLRRVQSDWTPGFGYEFLQRADGYPGLVKTYELSFAHPPRAMELSLIYKALASKQVDVIAGDATSALIDALDLARLDDTRRYFPPYDAVPVIRTAALMQHPVIARALRRLAGAISEKDMRAMNRAVDVDREDPRAVAKKFLATVRPS
jgi:osmoprotectant transport system substrate-binding protein/osmoprotectant transport system permease protein